MKTNSKAMKSRNNYEKKLSIVERKLRTSEREIMRLVDERKSL